MCLKGNRATKYLLEHNNLFCHCLLHAEAWLNNLPASKFGWTLDSEGQMSRATAGAVFFDHTQNYLILNGRSYTLFPLPCDRFHWEQREQPCGWSPRIPEQKLRSSGIKVVGRWYGWKINRAADLLYKGHVYWAPRRVSEMRSPKQKATAVQQGERLFVEAPACSMNIAFISTWAGKPHFGKTVTILFKEVPMNKVAEVSCERSLLKEEGVKMAADWGSVL